LSFWLAANGNERKAPRRRDCQGSRWSSQMHVCNDLRWPGRGPRGCRAVLGMRGTPRFSQVPHAGRAWSPRSFRARHSSQARPFTWRLDHCLSSGSCEPPVSGLIVLVVDPTWTRAVVYREIYPYGLSVGLDATCKPELGTGRIKKSREGMPTQYFRWSLDLYFSSPWHRLFSEVSRSRLS
jgi:hypothetical protein